MNLSTRLPGLCSIASFIALFSSGFSAHGAINDVFPGDYMTLPAGMTSVTGYAYFRQSEGPYVQNRKQMDGNLDIPILALRVSHFTKLGGLTFSPMVVLGWARADASPTALSSWLGKSAKGWGDLRVGGTLWLREDWQTREFLGITTTVILPTGNYDSTRLLNIGDNRTTLVLNGGWIKPLNSEFSVEILPEIAFYTDNNQYAGQNRLRKDATYAMTGTLCYQFTPQSQVFASAQINRGGATSINHIPQNDPANNTRFSFGVGHMTHSKNQLILRYSRDVHIENGFKTANELTVRHLFFF